MAEISTPAACFLCLDKPAGPTSFDLVRQVRKKTGCRKIGHGGTLDPFATGLMVLGLGGATRLLGYLGSGGKTYTLTVLFGRSTDSHDCTGKTVAEGPVGFHRNDLEDVLPSFVGEILQVPPAHSAIRVGGERSYARMHRGEEPLELPARTVRIDRVEILDFQLPRVILKVECGGGTYMRSLARDLGERLGCPAHAEALRRDSVDRFSLDDACHPEELEEGKEGFLPPSRLVEDWPCIRLDAADIRDVRQGRQAPERWEKIGGWDRIPDRVGLLDERGDLVAIAERKEDLLALAVVLPESDHEDL